MARGRRGKRPRAGLDLSAVLFHLFAYPTAVIVGVAQLKVSDGEESGEESDEESGEESSEDAEEGEDDAED